jgi:hypothetical protein
MLGSFSGFIIVLLAHFVKAKKPPRSEEGVEEFREALA